MKPILTPVILCGPGSNLYPLCDASSSGSSSAKALLAFANRPMLAFALQSVLSAGLSHCIVLAPASQHFAIVRALSSIRLIPPPPAQALSSTERRRAAKETKEERASWGQINFVEGGEGPSASSQPGMRVELLALGPHDGHGGTSRRAGGDTGGDLKDRFRRAPLGTAELVRWLAALGRLDAADPLILPVDLLAPAFPLRSLIDLYVQAQATHAEPPTVCCAFYERGAGEGVGRERDREGPPRLISAFSKIGNGNEGQSEANQLLFLRDSDLSTDLDVRRSLLEHASRASISTRLLDAHTYILNRKQIVPLLEANRRLTSLRDHVLPLVAKASWMKGVREKAGWPAATDSHARSDDDVDDPMHDTSDEVDDKQTTNALFGSGNSADAVQCLAVVVRLSGGDDEQQQSGLANFAARANTVATYLECNRWLLKALSNSHSAGESLLAVPEIDMTDAPPVAAGLPSTPQASMASATGNGTGAVSEAPVAASAQISADSIVGHGVKIGERASVKRSIVGHYCEIGRGARLAGCILLDGAKVAENCRLDNVICGANSSIGERSGLKDCDVAAGVNVPAETNVKNEKLVGDQGDDDDDDDDEGKESAEEV